MKRIFQITTLIFGLLFVMVLILSFRTMSSFPHENSDDGVSFVFGIFIPSNDYPYFSNIRQGVLDAAAELDCAVSFHEISHNNIELEKIGRAGFDGVAVYPGGGWSELTPYTSILAGEKLPVVLIEHLMPSEYPFYLVGTDGYDVGRKVADLVLKLNREVHDIAFLYSDKSPGLLADRESLELGFRLGLSEKEYNIHYDKTNANPLDGETKIINLLRQNRNLDLLILTDPNDTMAAIQVLVDQNLVGQVDIIGFGDEPAIREYIRKGVIQGAVVPNSYQIGTKLVETLYEAARKGTASNMVTIEASVLTGENANGP